MELQADDCVLFFNNNNNMLYRYVSVIYLLISSNEESDMILMEKEQILTDGRIRKRNIPLAEKVQLNEDPLDAITRAINEELSLYGYPDENVVPITHTFQILNETLKCMKKPPKESVSYPNLLCEYATYIVKITIDNLPKSEFQTFEKRANGYQINKWYWVDINAARKMNDDVDAYFK